MADVWVKNPSGAVGTISQDDLEQAVATGYEVLGDEEVRRYQISQKIADDPTTALQAAGQGAADILSFGMYSDTLTPEEQEWARALAERRPMARFAGEAVGGLAAGSVLGAGLGAAGLGVEGAEGANFIARLALREGVEGAWFGGASENSHRILRGEEFNGEDIAIAATKDAAIGALSATIIGGVAGLIPSARQGVDGVAGMLNRRTGLLDKFEESVVKPGLRKTVKQSGLDVDVPEDFAGDGIDYFTGKAGRERFAKANQAPGIRAKAFETGRGDLQTALEAVDAIEDRLSEVNKLTEINQIVRKGDLALEEQRAALAEAIDQIRMGLAGGGNLTSKLDALPDVYKAVFKELNKYSDVRMVDDIEKITIPKSLKKQIQKLERAEQDAFQRRLADDPVDTLAQMKLAEELVNATKKTVADLDDAGKSYIVQRVSRALDDVPEEFAERAAQLRRELGDMGPVNDGGTMELFDDFGRDAMRAANDTVPKKEVRKGVIHNEYSPGTESGEMFRHGDRLKQWMDSTIKRLESGKGDLANRPGSGELREALINYRENLKDLLENEALWGNAASFQRRVNETRSALIDPMKNFDKLFVKRVEKGQWGKTKRVVNEDAFKRFIAGKGPHGTVADPDSAKYKTFQEYLKRSRDHVKRVAQEFDDPDLLAKAQQLDDAVTRLGDSFSEVSDAAMLERRLQQLRDVQEKMGTTVEKLPFVGGMGVLGGTYLGGPGVGMALYMARHAGKMWTRPVDTIELLSIARGAGKTTDNAIEAVADGIAGSAIEVPQAGSITSKVSKVASNRAVFLHHLAGDNFGEVQEALATATPETIESDVRGSIGPIEAVFPGHALEAVQTAMRGHAYLMAHNPLTRDPVTGMPVYVSQTDMDSFMLRVETVRDPVQAIQNLRDNKAMSEELDALRHVYPLTFTRLQKKVHAEVMEASAKNMEIDYQKRITASMILDMPVEPMLNAKWMQEVSESTSLPQMGAMPNQGGSKKKSPDFEMSESYRTNSYNLELEYSES